MTAGVESLALPIRRAIFVYEAARGFAWASEAPIVRDPWDERGADFHELFVAAVDKQCGPSPIPSPAALHGAWVWAHEKTGWVYGPDLNEEAKTHPDMVAYDDLDPREQAKDSVFFALCNLAREWIQ